MMHDIVAPMPAGPTKAGAVTAQEAAATSLGLAADEPSAQSLAQAFDRALHAGVARFTAGLSHAALAAADFDWANDLFALPGKRIDVSRQALKKAIRLVDYVRRCALNGGLANA